MSPFHFPFFCLALIAHVNTASAASTPSSPSPPSSEEPVVVLGDLVVHATPFGRSAEELAETVSVLTGPKLDARRVASLGETLDGLPGVASTYFGPGASRPLIRGLGGERIRILANGLGASDVSGTSPDHAVSLDPALMQRIEILSGPAALLYGSSAVGGLVNVVEHRAPAERPAAFAGFLETSFGTNADAKSGLAHAAAPLGTAAWQVSLRRLRSGDATIPGFASMEPDEHDAATRGVLTNSAIDNDSGSFGISQFWEGGFAGVALSGVDMRYGVPGHAHSGETEEEPEEDHAGVQITSHRRRWDGHAEITEPVGWLRSARLRVGLTDYRHVELEGNVIGTRFDTEGWETRLDVLHQPIGPFEGALGAHALRTTLTAAGEEAFLPPTRTASQALYLVEEVPTGAWRGQFGARWERQNVVVRDGSGARRAADGLSAAVGAVRSFEPGWTLALSLARTERAPTAQELFAQGPHAATRTFEIGDADLAPERSTGLDVSLRRRTGAVSGAVTVFANDFDGFIASESTGEEEEGLSVFRYVAQDARFQGAELEATWHLHKTRGSGLDLTFTADAVRATNRTTGRPLPRIPASRLGIRLAYDCDRWSAGGEVRHVTSQTRVAPFEVPSRSYTLVSAYGGLRIRSGDANMHVFVRVSNALDAAARSHTSFLKDVAPLPGRDITLGVRWEF